MSLPVFSARFILYSATPVFSFSDRWTVTGKVEDLEGTYSASNLQQGDLAFLDTQGDVPVGGSVCRYRILEIIAADTPSFGDVEMVIQYEDSGSPVDPNISSYQYSFVCRGSTNQSLAWIAANDVQSLPTRLVQFARNADMFDRQDPFFRKRVKNGTLATFPQFKVLAWQDNGTVALAQAGIHSLSDIAGLNLKDMLPDEFGWILKAGYVEGALVGLGAHPGDAVYLSTTPGELTLVQPDPELADIIKIGRAEPPSGVATSDATDLHLEMQILLEK